MATSLILMIMVWTETGSIFERKIKSLTNPMTKDTLIKIETNSKSGQDLNFKNIGQNLIIQARFHQLQSLLQKSKQGSILLIVLQTSICKSCHIGRISHDKEVTINLGKSHHLMIVLNVTKPIIIDSQEKSCQHQGLNNRRQLRLASMFNEKHALASLLCKNLD